MVNQQEWTEICKLLKNNLSVPQISRILNRSTTTIYRLITSGGPVLFKRKQSKISKKIGVFQDYLNSRIRNSITNGRKLFLELKEQGYEGSYGLLVRYLKSYRENNFNKLIKPSIRFETEPGEQAQIDWGHFGKIEINDRIERLYCFVYILGYSRAIYIEFTIKQNLQTLEECHIHAFEKLGIPKVIVYDNMKTVVLRRERLDNGIKRIHLNPAFLDFAKYYGFEIKPTAPYWPRAKGKVEASVKYVRNNFMQGMKFKKHFFSLDELNEKVTLWVKSVANIRIHSTTGEKPISRWVREKSYLRFPDQSKKYITSSFQVRNSTQSGTIQYNNSFYSVPIEFARKKLFVNEINESGLINIMIYFEDRLIAIHPLSNEKGKFIFKDEHFIAKSSIKTKKIRRHSHKQKETRAHFKTS